MKIKAIETSVIASPFGIGGPPQLFAGHVWNRMETLSVMGETEDSIVSWLNRYTIGGPTRVEHEGSAQ